MQIKDEYLFLLLYICSIPIAVKWFDITLSILTLVEFLIILGISLILGVIIILLGILVPPEKWEEILLFLQLIGYILFWTLLPIFVMVLVIILTGAFD